MNLKIVNITMMTYNRPRLTEQALKSLDDVSGATVMIRDDNSDDETWDIVERFTKKNAAPGRVVYHTLNKVGTGTARNDVIATSEQAFGRGDYLYLSDSDVFFNPFWLRKLIHCYEIAWQFGFRVIGGVGHPYHHPIASLPCFDHYFVNEVLAQPLQSMLMRWDVWDEFGPFEETEPGKVCQGEDVLFTNKIRDKGLRVGVVSPPVIVNTGITNSFGEKIPGWELVKAQCPEGILCE